MANLKVDLLNELRNQKYYEEMELLRLAQEPNMNYRDKISYISQTMGTIASINNKIALTEAYFQEAPQQFNNVPQAPVEEQSLPVANVHAGHSHGE